MKSVNTELLPAVRAADRAVAAAGAQIAAALSSLLLCDLEVEIFERRGDVSQILLYPVVRPGSYIEPQFAVDAVVALPDESEAIAAAFGHGVGGLRRLAEFYRLFRTLEGMGGLRFLRMGAQGWVIPAPAATKAAAAA